MRDITTLKVTMDHHQGHDLLEKKLLILEYIYIYIYIYWHICDQRDDGRAERMSYKANSDNTLIL